MRPSVSEAAALARLPVVVETIGGRYIFIRQLPVAATFWKGCFWGYPTQTKIKKPCNSRCFFTDFGSVPGSQFFKIAIQADRAPRPSGTNSNRRQTKRRFDDAAQRRRSPFRATPKGRGRRPSNPSAGTNLQKIYRQLPSADLPDGRTPYPNAGCSSITRFALAHLTRAVCGERQSNGLAETKRQPPRKYQTPELC
jgi:hypothetical protein